MIPWPDSCCLFISTCILGHDDRGRLMRRTIARYLILALIQALRMTSIQVNITHTTIYNYTRYYITITLDITLPYNLTDTTIYNFTRYCLSCKLNASWLFFR